MMQAGVFFKSSSACFCNILSFRSPPQFPVQIAVDPTSPLPRYGFPTSRGAPRS
jgi:hypothetical protein